MIMGSLSGYLNQDSLTASTVAAQQYYYYPPGTMGVDTATITIGSRIYPLSPVYSQQGWDSLNAVPFQSTIWPQFIYPRKDDFGIWPIPQAVYTINFNRFRRDRNLLSDDYTTGTVSMTAGSTTIIGVGTAFSAAMVGQWFTITDTTIAGHGFWYRIAAFNSTTSIDLETGWFADSASTTTGFKIGETPEMPEEGHTLLAAGTASDYYAGLRNDSDTATRWNNVFWTGDMQNSTRDIDSPNVAGGLIGILKRYKDRERDPVIVRQLDRANPATKIWSLSIT